MWTFQYKHGDRPLDGYTIQRAAGRGGFGEVYYAISDSGREAALKVVQGYEQIELRGISQCMNLKSPHLVSIFDVKYNAEGRPFVIMEFVNGPSLRQLLDESPSGLGEQKAAFFLREIAKGLTFLHDCGIVHRDLKPGNVFYENGYVKIGDYGLSKAISGTQHSQQTVTVGTVHYMAPEIGAGRYDRSIDIYAMGAVLYEMITGTVPFIGASPSEILMKHLSAEPDCTGISEPFATVIKRAMAKDPSRRYQSIQEMVEAIFGAEHVRNSMSVFSPEELSVVAGRVAQHVGGSAPISSSVIGNKPVPPRGVWHRLNQRGGDLALSEIDPMSTRDRWLFATFISLVIAVAAGQLGGTRRWGGFSGDAAAMTFLGCWGAVLGFIGGWRWIVSGMGRESRAAQRATAAGCAIGAALLLAAPAWMHIYDSRMQSTWFAIAIGLFLADSTRWFNPERGERVSIRLAAKSAMLTCVFCWVFQGSATLGVAIVGGAALMVQVLSTWSPRAARDPQRGDVQVTPTPSAPLNPVMNFPRADRPAHLQETLAPLASSASVYRPTPRALRIAWTIAFPVLFTVGIMLLIGLGFDVFKHQDEIAIARAFGVGLIVAGGFALLRSFSTRYRGKWRSIAQPILILLCMESAIVSSIMLGGLPNSDGESRMIAMFFIIFPAIALVTVMLIAKQVASTSGVREVSPPSIASAAMMANQPSPHSRSIAWMLVHGWWFGVAGLQRFYTGKVGTGILYLITWGWCGIGQLVDLIKLTTGTFRDAQGRFLTDWDVDEAKPQAHAVSPAVINPTPELPRNVTPMGRAVAVVRVGSSSIASSLHAAHESAIRRQRIRALRNESGGLLSVLSAILIFTAVALSLGLALDAPGFFAAGLPDQSVAHDLETQVFGDADWPVLMRQFATVACATVAFLGACGMIFARRRGGVSYVLRGLLGAAGLIFATVVLGWAVPRNTMWLEAAPMFTTHRVGPGINLVLQHFNGVPTYAAGAMLLISVILISIPAKRSRRTVRAASSVAPRWVEARSAVAMSAVEERVS